MAQIVKLKPSEVIQKMLDITFGEGKTKATENNRILYVYSEIHYGCNEVEAGTWGFSNKGVHIYCSVTYDEAYAMLKVNQKPSYQRVIKMESFSPAGSLTHNPK
jgi:hypothetical protein